MTPQERAVNLDRIAKAAVSIERTHGVPAELTTGQCIIESEWLKEAPGNNAFGLKSPRGATHYQTITTTEHLTDAELKSVMDSGIEILAVSGVYVNGKRTIRLKDRFQVFATLSECFEAYADLLVSGLYFKDRFKRYLEHKDIERLLSDMSGADGQPKYFTGSGYADLWRRITQQQNVKDAIAAARRAADTET